MSRTRPNPLPKSPKRSPSPPNAPARQGGDEGTRRRLIDAAIRLFDRYGVEGASLRQVIAEAGQSNQSVIQYYFGGKDGLVAAALDEVVEQFRVVQASMEAELAAAGPQPGLRAVIGAYLRPLIQAHTQSDTLQHSVGFLGRVSQSASDYYGLVASRFSPYHAALLERLTATLPDYPHTVVSERLRYAVGTILHSLATARERLSAPGVDRDGERWIDEVIDFVAGGIRGYSPSRQ